MKIIFIIGFILCLTFSLLSEAMAFSINLDPPNLTLSIPPGGSESGIITLTNKGDVSLRVVVYTGDWTYGVDGVKEFGPAGTTPFSCADWLHIFPTEFELPAGESKEVQYTLTVPLDASGGHYGVIFFEADIGMQPSLGTSVRVAGRIGTIILQETEGMVDRRGSIVSLTTGPPDENKGFDINLRFKNEGNVRIGAKGTVNIIDKDGNFFGREEFPEIKTLPGDIRESMATWLGRLPVGEYFLVVTVDIGGEEVAIEELKITVIKKGQIEEVSADFLPDGTPEFSVKVANIGNINIEAKGRVEILDANKKIIQTLPLKEDLILPKRERVFTVGLDSPLSPGEYFLAATVDMGKGEVAVKEQKITVIKKGRIEEVSADFLPDGTPEFSVKVANVGNLNIEAKGQIEILNANREKIQTLSIKQGSIIPNSAQVFTAKLNNPLSTGEYFVVATMDIGEDKGFVKETKITVVKKGKIDGIITSFRDGNIPKFSLKFSNIGNISIKAKGHIEIIDTNGETIHVLPLSEKSILPHSEVIFTTELDSSLFSGDYKILATVNYGDKILTKEDTISIK
ncbi:hypothetical protein KKC91_11950 [bacterium]|nr:hypothetical protein [bacterium]MBU1852675.1 hypothetical protein [Candidatus Omnitrophota bacterium]